MEIFGEVRKLRLHGPREEKTEALLQMFSFCVKVEISMCHATCSFEVKGIPQSPTDYYFSL